MKDYCDGENFKSHPLFSVQRRVFQLFLYYDDLEICNPLGSKRGVQKIGMATLQFNGILHVMYEGNNFSLYVGIFFYTLGNMSPKLRSRLSSIQLLGVVKTTLIKKYTMPVILQPIIKDVKKLVGSSRFRHYNFNFCSTTVNITA